MRSATSSSRTPRTRRGRFRHNLQENALPIRQLGAFLPGTGIGGAGVHWNGQTWRFHPRDFTIRTSTIDRYGASAIPPGMTIQDWGITYDELEPYFDKFDYMAGIAGKAGNLKGKIIPGGNVVRGAALARVPGQAAPGHRGGRAVPEGRREARLPPVLRPDREPAVARTRTRTGSRAGSCTYCGFCERFGCEVGAKADPTTTVHPGRAQDRQVQDHQLRERVRDPKRRQDRPERPLLRQHGPGPGAAGRHHRDGRVRLQQREDAAALEARQAVRPRHRTRASSARTTPTRPAAAERPAGSTTSRSTATWAPARTPSRSTTSTPTTSTTPASASSAAGRSRRARAAPGRSRASRRRRARRPSGSDWKQAIRKYYKNVDQRRLPGRVARLPVPLPRPRPELPRPVRPPARSASPSTGSRTSAR